MKRMIQHFEQQSSSQDCVLDNSDTELILQDKDQVIPLTFRADGYHYVFEGSVMIKDVNLANLIRKTIKKYKGHARAQRIYESVTMQYDYAYGIVVKIQELREGQVRLIYEFKDSLGELKQLYHAQGVEDQIAWVKPQIDQLLEQRNQGSHLEEIDAALQRLAHELFILEAT